MTYKRSDVAVLQFYSLLLGLLQVFFYCYGASKRFSTVVVLMSLGFLSLVLFLLLFILVLELYFF